MEITNADWPSVPNYDTQMEIYLRDLVLAA